MSCFEEKAGLIPCPLHLHTIKIFLLFPDQEIHLEARYHQKPAEHAEISCLKDLLISGLILTVWNWTREPHLAFLSSLADSEHQVESLRSMKMMEDI